MALRLDHQSKKYSVTAVSAVALKPGIIEDGRIVSLPELKTAVESLLASAKPQALKPREVVISIPESKVFSVALQLPAALTAGELADTLRRKAAEVIPVEDQLLVADYQKHQIGQLQEYFYAATYQAILDDFEKLFDSLRIKIRMATVESLALATILGPKESSQPVLILDIGARTTIASIVENQYVRESVTMNNAGDLWTKAIVQDKGISWEEAEKMKQSIGVIPSPDNTLTPIVLPWLQRWSAEIKQFVTYWQQSHNETLAQVILTGGSAQLPGLADYAQTSLGLPVVVGQIPDGLNFDQANAARYLTIIGLAVMAVDEKLDDINFMPPKLKSIKRAVEKPQVVVTSGSQAAAPARPANKAGDNRRTLVLLAVLLIALAIFGVIWWRSQTPQPATVAPSAQTENYQSADIVYTLLTLATTTPADGHPTITATIEGQTQTLRQKQISAEYWKDLQTSVAKAGGNNSNKNDLYQALLQDQARQLWRDTYAQLNSKYAPDKQVLSAYLDYSVATSSPSVNDIVPGSDQFLDMTVNFRALIVDKKALDQILITGWHNQFQQDPPADYKTIDLTIAPLKEGVYQIHQIINGLVR
jgi:type IV pilus assembly protein PilM